MMDELYRPNYGGPNWRHHRGGLTLVVPRRWYNVKGTTMGDR